VLISKSSCGSEDLDKLSFKLICGDLIKRIFMIMASNIILIYLKMNLVKIFSKLKNPHQERS